jgi:hypothetical protein
VKPHQHLDDVSDNTDVYWDSKVDGGILLISPLELAPVHGKVARRLISEGRSIHARPFKAIAAGFVLPGGGARRTERIFMYEYPFTVFSVRPSLHSILCRL